MVGFPVGFAYHNKHLQEEVTKMMNVQLSHASNPDIPGYWDQPIDSGKTRIIQVNSIHEASKVCREYIDRNHLGGGNWTGGNVFHDGELVARISYNGRTWDTSDNAITF